MRKTDPSMHPKWRESGFSIEKSKMMDGKSCYHWIKNITGIERANGGWKARGCSQAVAISASVTYVLIRAVVLPTKICVLFKVDISTYTIISWLRKPPYLSSRAWDKISSWGWSFFLDGINQQKFKIRCPIGTSPDSRIKNSNILHII